MHIKTVGSSLPTMDRTHTLRKFDAVFCSVFDVAPTRVLFKLPLKISISNKLRLVYICASYFSTTSYEHHFFRCPSTFDEWKRVLFFVLYTSPNAGWVWFT